MYARSLVMGLGVLAFACQPDYVHVLVETSSSELVGVPWTVSVRVYGAGQHTERDFASEFSLKDRFYRTDFNLVLGDTAPDRIDLRVAVWDAPSRWSGDRLLQPPGGGQVLPILLSTGEIQIGSARQDDGDLVSASRFHGGVAMGWLTTAGVAIRTERVIDEPLGSEMLAADDPAASKLRLASQPTTESTGPEIVVAAWVGGDDQKTARMTILDNNGAPGAPIDIRPSAKDVWVAVAPANMPFAIAALVQVDRVDEPDELWLSWHDADGTRRGEAKLPTGANVTSINGLVVSTATVVAAVQTIVGSSLLRFTPGAASQPEPIPVDRVRAVALAADQERVLTVQVRGDTMVVQPHKAGTLEPDPADPEPFAATASLGFFDHLALGPCAVVWPEERDDGTGAIDLRARDLDPDGRPTGASRLVNSEIEDNHFTPSVTCMSQELAYATFLVVAAGEGTGFLRLRAIPSAPAE